MIYDEKDYHSAQQNARKFEVLLKRGWRKCTQWDRKLERDTCDLWPGLQQEDVDGKRKDTVTVIIKG